MIEETTIDDIRVIELNDGKVNFLSLPLRIALLAALERADTADDVAAVVLAGRGACFCAGMNIDDFEAGTALVAPSLHNEILDCLAQMSKPVVAAIHGGAHGGGLELALGCHYRVGLAGAKVSLPEVLVGMMPGARGTQHLPRAIGQGPAADMILNGRRTAVEAAPDGLIDLVVQSDLLEGAQAFAKDIAHQRPIPRLQDKIATEAKQELLGLVSDDAPAFPGIPYVIDALAAAVHKPYAEGVAQEFESFMTLKDSDVSKQFRAAFLAKLKADSEARRKKKPEGAL